MHAAAHGPSVQTKQEPLNILLPDPALTWEDSDNQTFVVALKSDRLGDSSLPEPLGRELMKTLLETLADGPKIPDAIVLYGRAVNLAQADHVLETYLQRLEKRGCDVLCCRISHAALQPSESPAVGHLADWIDMLACFERAGKVLWP